MAILIFFLLMNELLLVIKINEGSEVESMLQAIQEIVYQTVFDKKKSLWFAADLLTANFYHVNTILLKKFMVCNSVKCVRGAQYGRLSKTVSRGVGSHANRGINRQRRFMQL
jgi:hypothetical protein